jgi:hypothetical protein
MIVSVIFTLQAVPGLLPLAVIWIGGSCAIFFFGGRSLLAHGKDSNNKHLRLIGIVIQKGALFAFLGRV